MKKALPYIIMFALSTAGATGLVAVMFVTQPDLFQGAAVPADSTAGAAADSMQRAEGPTAAATDSVSQQSAAPMDSVSLLAAALEQERATSALLAEKFRTSMDSTLRVAAAADSVQGEQRRAMAKVLEAMDPESAAKILADFPDGDVKQIILTIKKRQAAKILAALEPDRAARIMR